MDMDHLVIPSSQSNINNYYGQPQQQQEQLPPQQQQPQQFQQPQQPQQRQDPSQLPAYVSAIPKQYQPQKQQDFQEITKSRRRSSSLPPAFHSEHFRKQVVFAPIQVAADSRPPPPHMLMKPSTPVQIQRLHRHRIQPTSPEELRATMDKQLQRMNFNDVTVAELKHFLRHYGHSTTGRKVELIERLQEQQRQQRRGEQHHYNNNTSNDTNFYQ